MIQRYYLFILSVVIATPGWSEDKITFDDHAKPIFQQRCASCHNSDRKSGGLDLTNYTNMMQGGGSGSSIEPGDADGSYLYLLVTHDESPEMPPDGNKIPESEISTLAAWINGGALENKGSVAKKSRKRLVTAGASIGVRPDNISYPWRMSLDPFWVTEKTGMVSAIATSPWATVMAISGAKQILLFDTARNELLGTLPFPEGRANDLKFSRTGNLLIAGGGRHGLVGKVFGWDVESGQRVLEIGEELDNVLATDISHDHKLVALGGPQKLLRVYSTETDELVYESKKHTDWLTAIAFSPDGVLLASADRAGGLQLWEAESGNEYLGLGGHSKSILGLSWRADGNALASVGEDGAVRLWEVENGRQIKSWNAHGRTASDVVFTRDGHLITTGSDRLAKMWQQDGKLIRQFKGMSDAGVAVSYCNESKRVTASAFDGGIKTWNAADGKEIGLVDSNPRKLSDRMNSSKLEESNVKKQLEPIQQEYEALVLKTGEIQNEINKQSSLRGQWVTEMEQLRKSIDETRTVANQNNEKNNRLRSQLKETESALPLVTSSKESALKASQLLTTDTQLNELAKSLAARELTLTQTVTNLKQQIGELDSQTTETAKKISQFETEINEKKSNVAAADIQLSELKERLKPSTARQLELDSARKNLESELRRCQQEIERWAAEIDFASRLAAKSDELAKTQQIIEARDTVLRDAKIQLDKAQGEYDKANLEKNAAVKTEEELRAQLKELRKRN